MNGNCVDDGKGMAAGCFAVDLPVSQPLRAGEFIRYDGDADSGARYRPTTLHDILQQGVPSYVYKCEDDAAGLACAADGFGEWFVEGDGSLERPKHLVSPDGTRYVVELDGVSPEMLCGLLSVIKAAPVTELEEIYAEAFMNPGRAVLAARGLHKCAKASLRFMQLCTGSTGFAMRSDLEKEVREIKAGMTVGKALGILSGEFCAGGLDEHFPEKVTAAKASGDWSVVRGCFLEGYRVFCAADYLFSQYVDGGWVGGADDGDDDMGWLV